MRLYFIADIRCSHVHVVAIESVDMSKDISSLHYIIRGNVRLRGTQPFIAMWISGFTLENFHEQSCL